jgi:hypothetical protein
MTSRGSIPGSTVGIFPEEEDSRGDHGLGTLVEFRFNLLDPESFFSFSTPVYKMRITQEPNKIELWNKLHFEEEKTESIHQI